MELSEQMRKMHQKLSQQLSARSTASAESTEEFPVDRRNQQLVPVLGMEKEFYLDITSDWYSKGTGTLEGIGKNDNGEPVCYVWVMGEVTAYNTNDGGVNFIEETTLTTDETPVRGKVNRTLAQNYADAFVKIYDIERQIFGEEPTEMIYDADTRIEDMGYLSDTAGIVNLIFFDIEHKGKGADTYGYFWSRDLLPNGEDFNKIWDAPYPDEYLIFKCSNEGNYLYINSYLSHDTGSMYDVIAHEFQHSISCNMKGLKQDLPDEGNNLFFAEMMSVAAEDLVFMAFPEITYSSPLYLDNYIPNFQTAYLKNGLEINAAESPLFYCADTMFINWLTRTYGVRLIKEILHNPYFDWEEILDAVKTVSGKIETQESLLRDFATSCFLGMDTENRGWFTSKPPVASDDECYCASQSYGYPLISYKLIGTNNKTTSGFQKDAADGVYNRKFPQDDDSYGNVYYKGFKIYDTNVIANLRPYGMMMHYIGYIKDSGDAVLYFSSDTNPSSDEKMYLVVYFKK